MAEQGKQKQAAVATTTEEKTRWKDYPGKFTNALIEFVGSLFSSLAAILLMVIKTPYILLPSTTHTSSLDETYNKDLKNSLCGVVDDLKDLSAAQRHVIKQNWLDQIDWTNSRATRERDANEVMRWWQIALGVAIPVISGLGNENILGADKDAVITVIGIFLAIVTGVYQFRRPEDRWRHYRIVHEKYLNELWDYVTLAGVYGQSEDGKPAATTHEQMFTKFNDRMTRIRREELTEFFGNVFPPSDRRLEQSNLLPEGLPSTAPTPLTTPEAPQDGG